MYNKGHDIEKNIRKRKKTTIFLIMVLLSAVFFIIIFKTDILTVKFVDVYGNHIISKEEVLLYSSITLGNNIFKEKIGQVHDQLLKDPYIKTATVKRKLPNKIEIRIVERKEEAAIPFMDDYLIIDMEGMVLRSAPGIGELKVIKGLQFSNFMEGEPLKVEDKEQLKVALEIINNINANGLMIKELDISDKENMSIKLTDTLLCKIGEGNDINYKLIVLESILKDLASKDITRGVIDISHEGYPSYRPVE